MKLVVGLALALLAQSSMAEERTKPLPVPLYGVTIDDISNIDATILSLQQIVRKPTSRVVFDYEMSPDYYAPALRKIQRASYVMGQIADSSDMKKLTVKTYQQRTQRFHDQLQSVVDIWEIGNEINGNWLGPEAFEKVQAAFDELAAHKAATALTFYYEGEPQDTNNCIESPGSDMLSWINTKFEMAKPPGLRSAKAEKLRLGLSYVFVSWYPDQCNELQPDWSKIFERLALIFPQAKLGIGEIGPARPQFGSLYEINLIKKFYSLSSQMPLPKNYVGGYFWWHFVAEMVPTNKTPLLKTMNDAIEAERGPLLNGIFQYHETFVKKVLEFLET